MDTIDLIPLKRSKIQNNLYNLFVQSFRNITDNLFYIIVDKQYEMRLDYLCNDLYGSVEYISFLMKLNDIFNPYSIKVGDLITYIPKNMLSDALYKDPSLLEAKTEKLIESIKSSNIDKARSDFLNMIKSPFKLPPVISTDNKPKQIVNGLGIQIAPNLFTNYGLGNIFDQNSYGNDNLASGINMGLNYTNTNTNTNVNTTNLTDALNNIFTTDTNINTTNENITTERILVRTFIKSGNTIISDTNETENNNE